MSVGLFFNQIKSLFYGFVGWFIPVIYSVGVYVYDWVHFPNYVIYIDGAISTTTQLYVEDIQLSVKYTRNRNGAILGYVGADELIDTTNYVGHVSLEGTIMMWGPDTDLFCVVLPFNMQLKHLMVDGEALEIVPQPESAQQFTSPHTRWRQTDVPNHYFISSPRVDIDVKFNRDDGFPYVSTTYFAQMTSRYDDKRYMPEFRTRGVEIDSFRLSPPQISASEFNSQLDKCALFLSMLKNKAEHDNPSTLANFRKFY